MMFRMHRRRSLLAGLAAVALAVGLWAGWPRRIGSPTPASATARIVTVKVERRELTSTLQLTASYTFKTPIEVVAPPGPTDDPSRQLVTRAPGPVGTTVSAGSALAEINYRPLMLLSGHLPLYRDLRPGAVGEDVSNLQDGLREMGLPTPSSEAGLFGPATQQVVADVYRLAGYEPDYTGGTATATMAVIDAADNAADAARSALDAAASRGEDTTGLKAEYRQRLATSDQVRNSEGVMVVASRIVTIPTGQLTIGSNTATTGKLVEPGNVLAGLTESGPLLSARLTASQARELVDGATVSVAGANGDCQLEAPVEAPVPAAEEGPDAADQPDDATGSTEPPARSDTHDLIVQVSCEPAPTLDLVGTEAVVTVSSIVAGPDSLVVPATALVYEADGSVSVETSDQSGRRRVAVEIVAEADGFVALGPTERLHEGTSVLVGD